MIKPIEGVGETVQRLSEKYSIKSDTIGIILFDFEIWCKLREIEDEVRDNQSFRIANELLKELLELSNTGASISLFIAFVYDALGDVSETISWLDKAVNSREPMVIAINTNWLPFKSIIDNPNFHAILRKLPAEISAVILNA